MRPVPVDTIVKGYKMTKNNYLFEKTLNNHLINLIN